MADQVRHDGVRRFRAKSHQARVFEIAPRNQSFYSHEFGFYIRDMIMDKTAYEFDAPSQADADFLASVRTRRIALQKELAAERPMKPCRLAIAALVSGSLLAVLVIAAIYLTPRLVR